MAVSEPLRWAVGALATVSCRLGTANTHRTPGRIGIDRVHSVWPTVGLGDAISSRVDE